MQCDIKALTGPINTKLHIPGSKKISNRALMLAALADGVSEITHINFNEYTKAFIHALQQAGIVIQSDEKNQSCIVAGCSGQPPKKQATIWCGDVETATRYLLTACAASAGVYYFDGTPALRKTPIAKQMNLLCRQGAQTIPNDNYKLPLSLAGADSFEGGEIIFEKNTLSSVLTAFLIQSPYARTPFSFTIQSNNKQNYIDMTCSMMAEFGVLVRRIHRGQFMIPVPQRYHARDYSVEPDFALLAFFFAAVTISGGDLDIQPFKRSRSKQIDIKSLNIFEKLGCVIQELPERMNITGPETFAGIEITTRKFSASIAALLSVAPFAQTPTKINYSKVFKARKKKWLELVKGELHKCGIRMEINDTHLIVYPGVKQGSEVDSHNDPLIGMLFAVIGLRVPLTILNTDYLCKLYPDFFGLWEMLQPEALARNISHV